MIKNIIKYKFAAFALAAIAAGTLASCSSVADETAPESKTVTASMDGISKPAFAPSSRTITDISTLNASWTAGDPITVRYTFYSDESGTTMIGPSDCPDGTTQELIYNGSSWDVSPESLRIPAATRSMKAEYLHIAIYNGGTTVLKAIDITYMEQIGTESFGSTTTLVVPSDITSTTTIKPVTWTRSQAAIVIADLAQGQSVTITLGDGTTKEVVCPTTTTDGTNAAVNAALLTTFVYYVTPDATGKTTQVTATAGDNRAGFTPSFTTEAGKMYIVHAGMLFGGAGDPNGGQPID